MSTYSASKALKRKLLLEQVAGTDAIRTPAVDRHPQYLLRPCGAPALMDRIAGVGVSHRRLAEYL
jgi:hypothetical protein